MNSQTKDRFIKNIEDQLFRVNAQKRIVKKNQSSVAMECTKEYVRLQSATNENYKEISALYHRSKKSLERLDIDYNILQEKSKKLYQELSELKS